jgi:hypothetical protein
MADAGVKAVDCMRALHERGSNLVIDALRGSAEFVEWQHYPHDEVHDPKSHAQYFFHAHPGGDRAAPDYGHFHTFMRREGMPAGVRPAGAHCPAAPATPSDSPAHLIAISMSPDGMPVRLFTTNRWVTDETWYKAADATTMLDRFAVDLGYRSPELDQWLTAMFVLFRPQIEELLIERDDAVSRWQARYPDVNVFEDRRLEITSSLDISLYDQIAWLDRQIEQSA